MSCPPEVMRKLGMLRETMMHGEQVQEWVSRWWAGLLLDDRRTLLAFAGLDESQENAKRPWAQYLMDDRQKVLTESKRLYRLTESVRWA